MVAMFDYHKVILEPSRTGTTIDPTINPRETSCPFLVRDVNPGFEKKKGQEWGRHQFHWESIHHSTRNLTNEWSGFSLRA